MELLIKEATSVTVLGRHVAPPPAAVVPIEFTNVTLAETGKSEGVICKNYFFKMFLII